MPNRFSSRSIVTEHFSLRPVVVGKRCPRYNQTYLSVCLCLWLFASLSLFLSVSLSLFKPLPSGWICFKAQPCTPLLRRAVFSLSRWSSSLVPLDEATAAKCVQPFCHNCRPAKLSNGSKPSRDCTRVRVRRTRRTEVRKTWQFQSELSYGTQTDRQTNRA